MPNSSLAGLPSQSGRSPVIPLDTIKEETVIIANSDGMTTLTQRRILFTTAAETAAVSEIQKKSNATVMYIFIAAAASRNDALDHCLFYAPPGLGKTTLANISARELGVNIKVTSGPVLARPGDLAAMLTTELAEGDILFIDEIHRLNPAVEEALYPAMEDFTFFINTGKGAGSTTLKLAVI